MNLSVTFNIATYNDSNKLKKCLYFIKKQIYPKNKIKINIINGGKADGLKKIAVKFKANLLQNKYKLAEPALYIGYINSKTNLAVYMATDNILHDTKWLSKMVKPFIENADLKLAFSKVSLDNSDSNWSNYINEDTDPFNSFVFGNSSHPDKFNKQYEILKKNKNYIIFKFDPINYPLIALAQCTICKTKLKRENKWDDIQDVILYIKRNYKIAYVMNTSIYHYSLSGYIDFIKKFNNRIKVSLNNNLYNKRNTKITFYRRIRKYLFLLYAITIIFPLIDAIKKYLITKNYHSILHPIACITMFFLIIKNILLK
jgi:hypothetical protein